MEFSDTVVSAWNNDDGNRKQYLLCRSQKSQDEMGQIDKQKRRLQITKYGYAHIKPHSKCLMSHCFAFSKIPPVPILNVSSLRGC